MNGRRIKFHEEWDDWLEMGNRKTWKSFKKS